MHPFIPGEEDQLLCQGCGEPEDEHFGNENFPLEQPDLPLEIDPRTSLRFHFKDPNPEEILCEICYMEYSPDQMVTLPCQHAFC